MKTEDKFAAYKMLFDILNNDGQSETEDDKTFRKNTTNEIINRDSQYTELLSHFVEITKTRNILKEFFKWTFYLAIIGSIIALIVIIYKLFDKYISSASIEQMLESAPLLITAMVGFVSTIIAIPVTITKYLFSTEEDKNITEIILHTQEHDTSGRKWAMDFKKIVDDLEEESTRTAKPESKTDKQAAKSTPKEQES